MIEEDIHHRVEAASGTEFTMERLAIHAADIKRFDLPPQRIKATDSRSKSFRQRFGNNAPTVELDALPAAELRRRIEEAVRGIVDFELWDRQLAVQQAELNCILEFAERMKHLPQMDLGRQAEA